MKTLVERKTSHNTRLHAIAAGSCINEPRLVIHLAFGRELSIEQKNLS
jgi:hypothetical protein